MDTQAGSISTFKQDVKNWIFERFDEKTTILDVGPGFGTYYNLFCGKYKNIDAVEIYYPNIIDYELLKKYRFVSCHDIVGFEYEYHDLIIFGDVLEHLTVEDAQKVLKYAEDRCKCVIVGVPYQWAQDGHENEHEKHIQDDLTKELMAERYPDLIPLYSNNHYGFYINKNLENK
jgi:hypothetical protein